MNRSQLSVERSKIIILAVVACFLMVSLAITLNQIPNVRIRSDLYLRWYASGKLLQEDRNIYDPRNATEVLTLVHGDNPRPRTINFFYPAHLLIFTAPLALLPFTTAHLIWTIVVQLFYLLGLWLVMMGVDWPPSANQMAIFLGAAFLLIPNSQHTIWAQFNTIGVLSLAGCYISLRDGRYGWAGIVAVGMTIKPQATALTLAFLLLWVLFDRARWRFYIGFALTGLILWGVTEFLQPGWVFDFLGSLDYYIPVHSVLDGLWNPYQRVSIALMIIVLAIILGKRKVTAVSVPFAGCVALTLAAWALVVPIVGMMHIVIMPLAVILILARLQLMESRLYPYAGISFIIVYLFGWVGFVAGFSDVVPYSHIFWAELAYKIILPILVLGFSLPLCFDKRDLIVMKAS